MPDVKPGESQDDYMKRCVPYVMAEAGTKGQKHAVAKCLGMWKQAQSVSNVRSKRKPNPLRSDPTRTATLRRLAETELSRRFKQFERELWQLIVVEDAFGLTQTTLVTAAYNPNQPRDSRGRWTSGGGGGGTLGFDKYEGSERPAIRPAQSMDDATFSKHAERFNKKITTEEQKALTDYSDDNSINESLREGRALDGLDQKQVQRLDSAIEKGKAPKAMRVERVIRIESGDEVKSLANKTVSDRAYTSTSIKGETYAKLAADTLPEIEDLMDISGSQFVRMDIHIPKGAPVAMMGKGALGSTGEVLLPRNAKLKIHAVYEIANEDRKIAGRKTFRIQAEYIPETTENSTINYNPNQPRDRGRWTSGGSAGMDREPLAVSGLPPADEDGMRVGPEMEKLREAVSEWKGDDRKKVANMALTELEGIPQMEAVVGTRADGKVMGIAAVNSGFDLMEDSGFIEVAALATAERGNGVQMVTAICAKAAEEGKGVFLVSAQDAVGFYRHIGMTEHPDNRFSLSPEEAAQFAEYFGQVINAYNPEFIAIATKIEPDNGVFVDARLTANTRWQFITSTKKLREFQKWLEKQLSVYVLSAEEEGFEGEQAIVELLNLPSIKKTLEKNFWRVLTAEGYKKGTARIFDDMKASQRAVVEWTPEQQAFYRGTKQEFLRSAFGRPAAIEKVKLLAARVFTDLKGITEQMSNVISRVLVEGLTQGQHPTVIARRMIKEGIGTKKRGVQSRALTIARTEIIRAHAEGQLDALEIMGVDEIGVMVEWSTSGFNVCPLCKELDGIVLTVKESRGMLPRHPNCRCCFTPANMGESTSGQKRRRSEIKEAIDKSIGRERGKNKKKRSIEEQKRRSRWVGADKRIGEKRPKSMLSQ